MIMQNKFIVMIAAAIPFGTILLFAQTPLPLLTPPEWKITLRAVDESGTPVSYAQAEVESIKPGTSGETVRLDGKTDTNGLFTAIGRSWVRLYLHATKGGFYSATKLYDLNMNAKERYEPWNPTIDLLLKRIGMPIPMYSKRVEIKLQQENRPMGFDLMAGDWVTPYGKGFHADMFFTIHRKIINERKYDATLTVAFPNKGDGIVITLPEPNTGSEFRTSRTAAENGYEPELDLHYSNTNSPESVFGYFIRVQTILDESGNVKSALYGKISGNFRFYAGTIAPHAGMGFTYYLNPTPNDRNVEFDPAKNLIKNLKPLEEVKEP